MSSNSQLIFTSSSQKAYDSWGYIKEEGVGEDMNQEGIEDPNNYRNNLRNVITIPKGSEIAVVNVEFTRAALFQAYMSNMFYWYYGPKLSAPSGSANNTGYLPYPIYFNTAGYGGQALDTLDTDALMRIFEQSLNYGVTHPDWWNRWSVSPNADGRRFQVTGNTAQFISINLGVPNYVPASGTLVPSWIGLHEQNVLNKDWSGDWTASSNGNIMTRNAKTSSFTIDDWALGDWDMNGRVICRTAPLSACGGHWIGSFAAAGGSPGTTGSFGLGLSRPQTHNMWTSDFGENVIAYRNRDSNDEQWKFCDYEVKFWDEGNTGTRKLHVYQIANIGEDEDLRQITDEVIYWGDTSDGRPAAQITDANMFSSGNKYQYFKWKLEGNSLSFTIGDKQNFTGTYTQVIFQTQVHSGPTPDTQLPLQVSQLAEALYPVVDLPTQYSAITTVQFDTSPAIGTGSGAATNLQQYLTAAKTSYNYPLDREDGMNTLAILGDDYVEDEDGDAQYYPGTSFWGSVYSGAYENAGGNGDDDENLFWKVGIRGVLELDIYHIEKNSHAGPTLIPQKYYQLDPDNESPNAINGFICQASDDGSYEDDSFDTPGEYKTHPDSPPNIQLLLGVKRKNLLQGSDGYEEKRNGTVSVGARGQWRFDGTDDLGEAPDPILVEVPSLNHQSYNMCRQCPSKFLYVCPRHDNNGDQFGKMFYEVTEKTYVALNNLQDIQVTDLEVKFTDKNGIRTKDLIGSSSVTFHVRKER
jgi:hypothetical protein